MLADKAYWISPSGDIIPVPRNHIDMVVGNPEKFRLTKEFIKDVYQKHKEPVGLEGKAREEIMADLIRDGWIRVRYLSRMDSFTVQLDKLSERKKNMLYAFASEAIEGIDGLKYSPHADLAIINLKANPLEVISLMDAISFKFKEARVINIKDYVIETRVARIVRKVLEQL